MILSRDSVIVSMQALKPLSDLEERIHEIASGTANLTGRIDVKSDDEVGSVTT
ncbi:MAG: HAMP domain-containing protein [Treponema sp.]|nr:HAMP domain-containing protein [Treponema sp.]